MVVFEHISGCSTFLNDEFKGLPDVQVDCFVLSLYLNEIAEKRQQLTYWRF